MIEYLIATIVGLLLYAFLMRTMLAVRKRDRQLTGILLMLSHIAEANNVEVGKISKILTSVDPAQFKDRMSQEEKDLRERYASGKINFETFSAEMLKL